MKKILFVTSEAHPLIKTGGLADVAGSLPKALMDLGQDVRIIMPNYLSINRSEEIHFRCTVRVKQYEVNILETRLPGTNVIVWLVDYAVFFGTPGNPYLDTSGKAWSNSAERFALLCRTVVEVAMNRAYLDWEPDIVHANDWQSGLVPALLSLEQSRPSLVFTIHNMAYQGVFPKSIFDLLELPDQLWSPDGVEFYRSMSFLKAALAYSDRITTVSPTYAKEIQTAEFGCGLEELLSFRKEILSGIINGIDMQYWNPETDANLNHPYTRATLDDKALNKVALQSRMGLSVDASLPLFGLVSRLVEQKGIDMVLDCLAKMATMPLQFVLLGSGDKVFEQSLVSFAERHPEKISITIGYDEALAHMIEAGADLFLMPSRFEPCGLNQMYSQRYGTLPIVRNTGGLADTVVDAVPETLDNHSATGIVFNEASAGTLMEAIKRSLLLYNDKTLWRQLQINSMQKDYSWKKSAQQYLALYNQL